MATSCLPPSATSSAPCSRCCTPAEHVVRRRTTIAVVSEVPVRELNQNTAGVLARVKRGEQIDITERGAVIARLIPAQVNPLAELIASGKLRPATVGRPIHRPSGPVRTDHEAGELLREMRDDERY
ncbi:MAG: type II toxin-antitoxin system prevent-host-death family antitoxin [Pseudonocardia sp.]|nr:type II toxin-antitoxin system prevent-host-death family antitoxin [Pseudonocardia sp.]